jgi:hypothetical protein
MVFIWLGSHEFFSLTVPHMLSAREPRLISVLFLWDCHGDFSGVEALGALLIFALTALTFSSGDFVAAAFSGRQRS